jgi:nucleotidyltransferase substrate binding protein (TIGR01987 family)
MPDTMLDLSPLQNALRQLRDGLALSARHPDESLMRDGVIQRFEFCYELSHKMLKRYLEQTAADPQAIDAMAFQTLIRTGSEQGLLLHGWEVWKDYRTARSITSHTYDEQKAMQVLAVVPAFLEEAEYLLVRLQQGLTTA